MTTLPQNIDPDFEIYPAIDLHEGQVVRLKQGDLTRETVYSQNPAHIAENWCAAGAHWLHIVNLDGAFGYETTQNRQALVEIVKITQQYGVYTQLGGGIRNKPSLEAALEIGVDRVILGTTAVHDPDFVESSIHQIGARRIAVGLDAIAGTIYTLGWKKDSGFSAIEIGRKMFEIGLHWAIFTNIARDGLQEGADFEYARRVAQETKLKVILAGGVREFEDLTKAALNGLQGLIVGKALYEKQIDLKMAVNFIDQAKNVNN